MGWWKALTPLGKLTFIVLELILVAVAITFVVISHGR